MPKKAEIDSDDNTLLVTKCVHEMQEVRVMESITSFACEDDDGKYNAFYLMNLNISPVEATALFSFLGYIKNLHVLQIAGCRMEHFALRELAKLLQKDNEITNLQMVRSRISDEGAKHIFDALTNENCEITQLSIIEDILTAESAKYPLQKFHIKVHI